MVCLAGMVIAGLCMYCLRLPVLEYSTLYYFGIYDCVLCIRYFRHFPSRTHFQPNKLHILLYYVKLQVRPFGEFQILCIGWRHRVGNCWISCGYCCRYNYLYVIGHRGTSMKISHNLQCKCKFGYMCVLNGTIRKLCLYHVIGNGPEWDRDRECFTHTYSHIILTDSKIPLDMEKKETICLCLWSACICSTLYFACVVFKNDASASRRLNHIIHEYIILR